VSGRPNLEAEAALQEAVERYTARNPRSLEQHQAAAAHLPGGNTRTVLYAAPVPLAIIRAAGARLWSLDGHEYRDFLGEFTAGLYGHSEPAIRRALDRTLDDGISFGAHNLLEAKLAGLICARFPSIENLRFTNSGTEANLMALSTARAITGRDKIIVFAGAYHGGVFVFAGGGCPLNAPFQFVVAPYNDTAATVELIRTHADNLAAVILEPMLGSGGCIPAEVPFLAALREETRRCGAFLVFDEVMTSRLSPGGLQGAYGIFPDITTLGKYLGGGMNFGAFGGSREIMSRFDPRSPNAFPHAGTFNNNVMTMAAGIAGLSEVFTPEAAIAFNARGEALRQRLNSRAEVSGVAIQFTGIGSMMTVHMCRGKISSPAGAKSDPALKDLFYFDMLDAGIWMAKRGMINLSLPLTDDDIAHLESAVDEFIQSRGRLLQ